MTNPGSGVLVTGLDICRSFPDEPVPLVIRDQCVHAIDDYFASNGRVALVEGVSGVGKTVLMTQVARHYENNCICLFVNGANKWTYHIDVCLYDLYNQIHWAIEGTEYKDDRGVNEASIAQIMLKLRNQARKDNRDYIFVLDGLDQIPSDQATNTRAKLWELLRWEYHNFKFVISTGNKTPIRVQDIDAGLDYKPFPVYPFSREECRQYLADLSLDYHLVDGVSRACRFMPRLLSRAAKRLRLDTCDANSIRGLIDKLNEEGFLENDWIILKDDKPLRHAVGHMIYDRRKNTIAQLAAIVAIDEKALAAKLENLSFVVINKHDGSVQIDNIEDKKIISEYLKPDEACIKDKIAEMLLASSIDDPNDAYYLPNALRDAGRYQEVLERLSPEILGPQIDKANSLVPIHQMTTTGLEVAKQLDRINGILQLSLCTNAIRQSMTSDVTEEEVLAHALMEDYDGAVLIAEQSRTKENRLRYLAVILSAQADSGSEVDEDLKKKVKDLAKEVDLPSLGAHAADIAGNIIDILPETAADILDRIEQQGAIGEAGWHLASTVTRRMTRDSVLQTDNSALVDKVFTRLNDGSAKDFLIGLRAFGTRKSAKDILVEIEKALSAGEKIVIGRNWLKTHYKNPDAAAVSIFILDVVIGATGYSPNASLYRDLALSVPYASNPEMRGQLLSKLEAQIASVEKRGPTIAYARLLGIISWGEYKSDQQQGVNKFYELITYCKSLKDRSLSASCWAVAVEYMTRCGSGGGDTNIESILTQSSEALKNDINAIIEQGAEHFSALETSLGILARIDLEMALEVAGRLNLVSRRDRAYSEIASRLLDSIIAKDCPALDAIWRAFERIQSAEERDSLVLRVVSQICANQLPLPLNSLEQIDEQIKKLKSPIVRARCCQKLLTYKFWNKLTNGTYRHRQELLESIRHALGLTTDHWEKVSGALMMAGELRSYDLEASKELLKLVEGTKGQCATTNANAADAYENVARIACRAFVALARTGHAQDTDWDRVTMVVNRISSPAGRYRVLSHILLRLDEQDKYRAKCLAESTRLWANMDEFNRGRLLDLIPEAVYLCNPTDTIDRLESYDALAKDNILYNIILWFMRRVPNTEPYEHNQGDKYKMEYSDWIKIRPLLERIQTDGTLYAAISGMADSFNVDRNLTAQQAGEMHRFLMEIIDRKLPDPNNIRHEGYKIISEAEVIRIKNDARPGDWDALRERAEQIPNAADRIFVLIHLAGANSRAKDAWRRNNIDKARKQIDQLPTIDDKTNRLIYAAEVAEKIDKALAKDLVKQAWEQLFSSRGTSVYDLAKNVIDAAYHVDPQLASSFITSLEDDPVRLSYKRTLRERVNTLKQADKKDDKVDNSCSSSEEQLSDAVHIRLGRLHADKEKAAEISETNSYIVQCSGQSLGDVYWVYAYHIENAARKCEKGFKEYRKHVRDIFEGAVSATEICWRVASRPSIPVLIGPIDTTQDNKKAIEKWLIDNGGKHVVICDPYWSLEDGLMFVRRLYEIVPSLERVTCVAGPPQYAKGSLKSVRDLVVDYWRAHIEKNSTPKMALYHVYGGSPVRCPIHSRVIISGEKVLNIDTSLNSVEGERISVISECEKPAAQKICAAIDKITRHEMQEFEGEKLCCDVYFFV